MMTKLSWKFTKLKKNDTKFTTSVDTARTCMKIVEST